MRFLQWSIIVAAAVGVLFTSSPAQAQLQSNVPEVWPGKVMIGVRPLGMQLNFNNAYAGNYPGGYAPGIGDYANYKLAIDVAGIIANLQKVTIWLGGEFNLGGRPYLAFIEPGLFVQITLEKLLKIPLVPLVRAGVSGPIYIPYGFNNTATSGAFQVKLGVGAYYFLTKHIGVGAETNFAFGPAFVSTNVPVPGIGGVQATTGTGFGGYWDFIAGVRFAL